MRKTLEKVLPWFLAAGLAWNAVLHVASWRDTYGAFVGQGLLMLLFVILGPIVAIGGLQVCLGAALKTEGLRVLMGQSPVWLRCVIAAVALWAVVNPFLYSPASAESSLIGYFLRLISMFYVLLYAAALALLWPRKTEA